MAHAWSEFLVGWRWFALNIAPWLIIAGIPSMITALTKYPKADGVVQALKFVLNMLSVLAHDDSPHTMKPPLTMSRAPLSLLAQPDRAVHERGYSLLIMLCALGGLAFGAVLMLMLGGCATLTAAQMAQRDAFARCMEQKGEAAALSVGQEAWTDLSTGTDGSVILSQLEVLAGRAGIDSVGCAVTTWLSPSVSAELNPAGVRAAKAFLEAYR